MAIARSAIPIRASFLTVSIDKKIERRECTPDYLANTYECQFDNFYPSHERISKDEKELGKSEASEGLSISFSD